MRRMRAAVRAEWLKFRTTRATVINAAAAVVASGGYAALFAFSGARDYLEGTAAERADFDPGGTVFRSFLITQVFIAIMGAFTVTTEYRAGSMATSVTVMPGRGMLLAAKTVVAGAVGLVVGQLAAFSAFFVGQVTLSAQGVPSLALGDPGVVGAVVGAGLVLGVLAVFGVVVGTLVRLSAGAVSALAVFLILIPQTSPLYPDWLAHFVIRYWPNIAGMRLGAFVADPRFLSGPTGFALMCGFVAVTWAVAVTLFRRRDV